MLLLLHISVALISLGASGFCFFYPSKTRLYFTYGLVALTLVSGTILVISGPAHILSTCISGLIYIFAVSAGLIMARNKLAHAPHSDSDKQS